MRPVPTRRDVIKGAAAASLLASLPAVHAAGSDRLRVGLVGCGDRGTGAAAQALAADPNVALVAMAVVVISDQPVLFTAAAVVWQACQLAVLVQMVAAAAVLDRSDRSLRTPVGSTLSGGIRTHGPERAQVVDVLRALQHHGHPGLLSGP